MAIKTVNHLNSCTSKRASKKRKISESQTLEKPDSGDSSRKLAQEDLQRLFMHALTKPDSDLPEHLLQFKVVLPHPNGKNEKLSPPQYEYPDALYLIMAPAKYHNDCPFGKGHEMTTEDYYSLLPFHLRSHVVTDLPPDTPCDWSLSGPQYSRDNGLPAVQLRYCYPKGREEYESRKGAALYTVYNDGGKEVTTFRFLHVYHSTKRVKNASAKKNKTAKHAGRPVQSPKNKSRQQPASEQCVNEEADGELFIGTTGLSSNNPAGFSDNVGDGLLAASLESTAYDSSRAEDGAHVPDDNVREAFRVFCEVCNDVKEGGEQEHCCFPPLLDSDLLNTGEVYQDLEELEDWALDVFGLDEDDLLKSLHHDMEQLGATECYPSTTDVGNGFLEGV